MLALCLAIALLTSCIPMHRAPDLDRIAVEEWYRAAPPVRFLRWPIEVHHCLGLPAVLGGETRRAFVPWPLSLWDWTARIVLRYELSKASYALHASKYVGIFAAIDAILHLPPSELYSWWRMFVPGTIEWSPE